MADSDITIRNQQANFSTADIDRAKTFVYDNEFERGTLINLSGAAKDFPIGLVLGRDGTTRNLKPVQAAGNDGSQFPVGILATDVSALANNGTIEVDICIFGDVNSANVSVDGSDTLDSEVSDRTIADRIKSDTKGIRLITIGDQTFADN